MGNRLYKITLDCEWGTDPNTGERVNWQGHTPEPLKQSVEEGKLAQWRDRMMQVACNVETGDALFVTEDALPIPAAVLDLVGAVELSVEEAGVFIVESKHRQVLHPSVPADHVLAPGETMIPGEPVDGVPRFVVQMSGENSARLMRGANVRAKRSRDLDGMLVAERLQALAEGNRKKQRLLEDITGGHLVRGER